jgi:hypothetical protein
MAHEDNRTTTSAAAPAELGKALELHALRSKSDAIIRMAAPLDRPSKNGQPVRVAKPVKFSGN